MDFIIETSVLIVIVVIFGLGISYLVWRLKGQKTEFGEFVNKYGEMLAWLGIILTALIIASFNTFLN